jgi:hypothetical protein
MSNFEDSTQESKEGTFASNRLGDNYHGGMFSDSHLPNQTDVRVSKGSLGQMTEDDIRGITVIHNNTLHYKK